MENVLLKEGDQLYLSVYVKGSKPLSLQWYKNGEPIEGAIYSKYVVRETTLAHAGEYTFVAENPAGRIEQQATITIVGTSLTSTTTVSIDTSDPEADSDGDGLSNLLELALGSDPADPNSTYTPMVDTIDDGSGEVFLSISYTVSKNVQGITVVLEESTDLINWSPVDLSKATVQNVDYPDYVETTVYIPASGENRFFRVTASQ